jgi:hypothetical protein
MASYLPQEILSLIAQHAARGEDKLTPYTLINRSWQAAFEKQIYASIVVLGPSNASFITVSPEEQHKKRGLSLERLDKLTTGSWQQARRTYVRRILYRVAVPYWLSDGREKDEDYTYDNVCRRQNNSAFSQGIKSLFDYLSTWEKQHISLDIALQAESVSTDEDAGEPGSLPASGDEDAIAPYCANFSADCSLPCATCIISLDFPELWTPAMVLGEHDTPDLPCSEDKISLPAILKIASACSTLQRIQLNDNCDIPSTEPEMGLKYRIATANGLAELPSGVRGIDFCWSWPSNFDIPETRSLSPSLKPDPLCVALHKVSMQLQHLHIEDMAVFPELFCPEGFIAAHWPHLETLRLDRIDGVSPSGGISRYADGSSSDEILTECYIDDLYTSLGHAAQRMPKLKRAHIGLAVLGHELKMLFRDNQWILRVRVDKHYKPSRRFLLAWKVPGEELQQCKGRGWQQATYTSWPPA